MLQEATSRQLIAFRGFLFLTYYLLTFFFEVRLLLLKLFCMKIFLKDSSPQDHKLDEYEASITSINKPHLKCMPNLVKKYKSFIFLCMMKNVTKTLLLSDKLPTFFHSFLTRITHKNVYTYKKQGQKTHTLHTHTKFQYNTNCQRKYIDEQIHRKQ